MSVVHLVSRRRELSAIHRFVAGLPEQFHPTLAGFASQANRQGDTI
jgi:hypothetical protein